MDKKFILRAIILNSIWVLWIVISIVLGYIIYREGFPSKPFVIIPFSLLFLAVGGAGAYLISRVIKKTKAESAKEEREHDSNDLTENLQTEQLSSTATEKNDDDKGK